MKGIKMKKFDSKEYSFAVFIDSFDGYSDVWNAFFEIFNRFWNDCVFPKYLVTNNLSYLNRNVRTIKTGDEINWFIRTKKALESIEEEYILFMLEDYFLSRKINNNDFFKILDYMKKNDIYYYRLSPSNLKKQENKYIYNIPKNQKYAISLQPAIWKRETLINIIDSMPNAKTAWDFEIYFTKKYHQNLPENEFIDGICYDSRDILGYKNGILQGKWIRDTLNYYKKINININIGNRKKLNILDSFIYNLKIRLDNKLSPKLIKKIKTILSKVGFHFFSE